MRILCVFMCGLTATLALAQQPSGGGDSFGTDQGSAQADPAASTDQSLNGEGADLSFEIDGIRSAGEASGGGADQPAIRNPFEAPPGLGGGEMMEMMMEDMDMEGYGAEMGSEMDSGYGGDYGGGGMGMDEMHGGMGSGPAGMMGGMAGGGALAKEERLFRAGLQRAIAALQQVKTEDEKKTLIGYVQIAFQQRYDRSIKQRRQELDRIKERVAKLEVDLKRRQAAKNRVIEVQLQSVQLAAEGLLELNQ